jgi:hypothetical protein
MMPPLPDISGSLKLGRYRHFKGGEYLVLGIARHSETLEPQVIYQALYGERGWWVRPLTMFCEKVDLNGTRVPRFEFVAER